MMTMFMEWVKKIFMEGRIGWLVTMHREPAGAQLVGNKTGSMFCLMAACLLPLFSMVLLFTIRTLIRFTE